MFKVRIKLIGGALAAAGLAIASLGVLPVSGPVLAQGRGKATPPVHEITVTITRVRAIGKIDATGRPDFYAQVTIAGEAFKTPRVPQKGDIAPNWRITKVVPPGKHDIRLEILDKDVFTKDDLIDINALTGKRHQDFSIDTRSCRVSGFAGSPRCGATITRAGTEPPAAEVSFDVTVTRK